MKNNQQHHLKTIRQNDFYFEHAIKTIIIIRHYIRWIIYLLYLFIEIPRFFTEPKYIICIELHRIKCSCTSKKNTYPSHLSSAHTRSKTLSEKMLHLRIRAGFPVKKLFKDEIKNTYHTVVKSIRFSVRLEHPYTKSKSIIKNIGVVWGI